jgi:hypothetical protein
MKKEWTDFTGIGLFSDAYSFERPSSIATNAIMNALTDNGFTNEQALNWVYSKSYRHFLDGKEGAILNLIYKLASKEAQLSNPKEYDYELDKGHQQLLNKYCQKEQV